MLAVNGLCVGVGAGVGALVGATVPLALVGFFVGFGARMEPESAKQPLLVWGQVRVRQVERGGDRHVLRR